MIKQTNKNKTKTWQKKKNMLYTTLRRKTYQLTGKQWHVFYDSKSNTPLCVSCKLKDGWKQWLWKLINTNHWKIKLNYQSWKNEVWPIYCWDNIIISPWLTQSRLEIMLSRTSGICNEKYNSDTLIILCDKFRRPSLYSIRPNGNLNNTKQINFKTKASSCKEEWVKFCLTEP